MKVGVLFSGGKDSTFAAYTAKQEGYDLRCLITLVPNSLESYLFHYPNITWTNLQAKAIGLPIIKKSVLRIGEAESEDLEKSIIISRDKYHIEGIISGGIASNYQKTRFDKVCNKIGLKHFSPIWLIEPEIYMKKIIKSGFQSIITGVAAEGLDQNWLGRVISYKMIDELKELNRKKGLHIAFEGGEAETFVTDCPLFRKRIVIQSSIKHWFKDHGYLEIRKATLLEKS